jgi:hypothetical protein
MRDIQPSVSFSRARRIVMRTLRWSVVLAGLLLGLVAYVDGQMYQLLLLTLVAGMIWGTFVRLVAVFRGRLRLVSWRAPIGPPPQRAAWLQAVNRALFWSATGLTLIWTTPVYLLEPGEYRAVIGIVAVATVIDVLLTLVLGGGLVRPVWNALPLLGWLFLGIEALRIVAGPPGAAVELTVPCDGEWAVVHGGRSALVNHHYPILAQSHALDLVKLEAGRTCVGDPARVESYPAFGAVVRAPNDGRVVRAVDAKVDVAVGQTDVDAPVGNHVVIQIGPAHHVLLAHLQHGSVEVREGQTVQTGEPVGRCGNSGNTSQPHLHLQVQSGPDFEAEDLTTYPIVFRGGQLLRGRAVVTGSPRRNDRIVATPAD